MSATVVRAQQSGHRSGWMAVRRATSLMLWGAAPWVLVVLVLVSVVGIGLSARLTWSALQRGTRITVGDGGVAAFVDFLVGVVSLLSWARTVRSAVPVLVAGGVTRRAATGGLLVGVVALTLVTTASLTAVALAGAAVQRAVVTSSPAPPAPSSGSDAYASSLTLTFDAPAGIFNPVETLPWSLALALGGALIGAAWCRWRAQGVALVLAAVLFPWAAYLVLVVGVDMNGDVPDAAAGAVAPLLAILVGTAICAALAVATWLVLRRVPLRPPSR